MLKVESARHLSIQHVEVAGDEAVDAPPWRRIGEVAENSGQDLPITIDELVIPAGTRDIERSDEAAEGVPRGGTAASTHN